MFEAGPNPKVPMYSTTQEQITKLSPQEEALQSLCKQLLKSRLFRGYYLERRFVQPLNCYRDVISLQRTERELEKLLIDLSRKLQLFYSQSMSTEMWIGITNGALIGTEIPNASLETFIWVEMDELAFGQYWFSIKTIRFRQNEIILKLKAVREVEDDVSAFTSIRKRKQLSSSTAPPHSFEYPSNIGINENDKKSTTDSAETADKQIDFQDFIEIVRQWRIAIKHTIYEFMAQDVNKENIKGLLRFIVLLIISLMSGAIEAVKFIGIFTLRFMYEFGRLTHVMTPIILKIIDVLQKIVGGLYILIAMIWRDTFGKKAVVPPQGVRDFNELRYDRPMYRAIKYDVRESRKGNFR